MEVNYFHRIGDAKICNTLSNGIEICYHIEGPYIGGLLNCQYDYSNGTMSFVRGANLKCSPLVKELVFMPANNATAVLYNESSSIDVVSIMTWTLDKNCKYPVTQFYNTSVNAQSITLQNRNSYEHLLWSGNDVGVPQSPMSLMTQRGKMGGGYGQTCHLKKTDYANPAVVDHVSRFKPMNIKYRYAYDNVTYPVTYIPFDPRDIDKEMVCVKQ